MSQIEFQIVHVDVRDQLPQCFPIKKVSATEVLLRMDVDKEDDDSCEKGNLTVSLFGCDESGNSVLARVEGHHPYRRYIQTSRGVDTETLLFVLANQTGVDVEVLKALRFSSKSRGISISTMSQKLYGWEPHPTRIGVCNVNEVHKIFFPTLTAYKKARYAKLPNGFEAAEMHVSPELQFMHDHGIKASGWVKVTTFSEVTTGFVSHCSREILTDTKWISAKDCDAIPPMLVCSFDIECHSKSGGFPDATKDSVVMASLNFWRHGTEIDVSKKGVAGAVHRVLICVGTCDEVQGCDDLRCVSSEADLLLTFRDVVVDFNPSIMVGYNTYGFDIPFMCTRAQYNRCDGFFYMSMYIGEACEHKEVNLSSAALGFNKLYVLHRSGGIMHDMFLTCKVEHSLPLYSLNHVAQHFLGDCKDDMPISELFAAFGPLGTSEARAKVGKYCIKDSDLPLRLVHRLKSYVSLVEMSRVTHTQIRDLLLRGQQLRVANLLYVHSKQMQFVMNVPKTTTDSYKGATVIPPKKGFYSTPIVVCDFQSLYPSIICWKNLCYSRYVADPRFLGRPGVKYDVFEMSDGRKHFFAGTHDGVLRMLERELMTKRSATKKAMKQARSEEESDILNGRQLALKLACNSLYGMLGADCGIYPAKPIAETITFVGRQLIQQTTELAQKYEDVEVVYGDTDSVMLRFFAPDVTLEEAFERGEKLAATITTELVRGTDSSDIVLEFEKVMVPCLFLEKKKYAALSYTTPHKAPKCDEKGLCTVRRDTTAIARHIVHSVLFDGLLFGGSVECSLRCLQNCLDRLVRDEFPKDDYIQTRALGDVAAYANPDSLPHIQVVKKMEARAPGSAPRPGDRVPFVIVEGTSKSIATRAEDPTFAITNQLCMDRLYILEQQVENNVLKIFDRIGVKQHIQIITEARTALKSQRIQSVQGKLHVPLLSMLVPKNASCSSSSDGATSACAQPSSSSVLDTFNEAKKKRSTCDSSILKFLASANEKKGKKTH